jgi:predicted transcriptional regulator
LLHKAALVDLGPEGEWAAPASLWRISGGTSINGAGMPIVTLSIASWEEVSRRAAAAFRGEQQGAHISFDSVDLLWNTRKRWEILRAMTGQGALSIREAARRVGRDVKAVHGNVTALLNGCILDQAEADVVFPYDAVHVDFTLTKAA